MEGVKGTRFVLNATDTFGLFFTLSLFCHHLEGKNQLLLFIGNASTNPDNWCYNANLPYGVHNSTGCKGGDTTLKWVRMISVDISVILYSMFGISFRKSLMGYPTNSPQDLCLSAPLPWRGPIVQRTVHQREYEAWSRKVWKNKTKIVPWKCSNALVAGTRLAWPCRWRLLSRFRCLQKNHLQVSTTNWTQKDNSKGFLPGSDATSDNPPTAAEPQNRVVLRKDPRSLPASSLVWCWGCHRWGDG